MTDLSGELGGMTLTHVGNPHYLIGDAYVSNGLALTVSPGVEVWATGFFGITIRGTFASQGAKYASGQPVPAKNDWRGFICETAPSLFSGNTVQDASIGLHFPNPRQDYSIGISGNNFSGNTHGFFYYRRPKWDGQWTGDW